MVQHIRSQKQSVLDMGLALGCSGVLLASVIGYKNLDTCIKDSVNYEPFKNVAEEVTVKLLLGSLQTFRPSLMATVVAGRQSCKDGPV